MKGVTSALDAKFLKQRRQKLQRSVLVPGGGSFSEVPDSPSHGVGGTNSRELSDGENDVNDDVRQSSRPQKLMKHAHSQPLLRRRSTASKHVTSAPVLEDYGILLRDEREGRGVLEEQLEESIRSIFQEVQMRRLLSLHKSSTR